MDGKHTWCIHKSARGYLARIDHVPSVPPSAFCRPFSISLVPPSHRHVACRADSRPSATATCLHLYRRLQQRGSGNNVARGGKLAKRTVHARLHIKPFPQATELKPPAASDLTSHLKVRNSGVVHQSRSQANAPDRCKKQQIQGHTSLQQTCSRCGGCSSSLVLQPTPPNGLRAP